MTIYMFLAIAVFALIPLLYILPMGYTLKGKLLLVSTSILLAMIALIANEVMNWWQTGLLLVLLAGLFTILLERKFSQYTYQKSNESSSTIHDHTLTEVDEDRSKVESEPLEEDISREKVFLQEDNSDPGEVTGTLERLMKETPSLSQDDPFLIEEIPAQAEGLDGNREVPPIEKDSTDEVEQINEEAIAFSNDTDERTKDSSPPSKELHENFGEGLSPEEEMLASRQHLFDEVEGEQDSQPVFHEKEDSPLSDDFGKLREDLFWDDELDLNESSFIIEEVVHEDPDITRKTEGVEISDSQAIKGSAKAIDRNKDKKGHFPDDEESMDAFLQQSQVASTLEKMTKQPEYSNREKN